MFITKAVPVYYIFVNIEVTHNFSFLKKLLCLQLLIYRLSFSTPWKVVLFSLKEITKKLKYIGLLLQWNLLLAKLYSANGKICMSDCLFCLEA